MTSVTALLLTVDSFGKDMDMVGSLLTEGKHGKAPSKHAKILTAAIPEHEVVSA